MTRVGIALVALVVALAGPARTWCEASCLKPSTAASHCPAHEHSDRPSVAATKGDCPAIDAARPMPVARVEVAQPVPSTAHVVASAHLPSWHLAPGTRHPLSTAPLHQLNTPLRI